jgi:hypothetical protein
MDRRSQQAAPLSQLVADLSGSSWLSTVPNNSSPKITAATQMNIGRKTIAISALNFTLT